MRTKMKLMKPLATQNTAVSNLHRGHNYKCTSSVNSGPSQKKKKTTTTTAYRDVKTVFNRRRKFYFQAAKNKDFRERSFLCFALCLPFRVQKISVLVTWSRISEKSQLTVFPDSASKSVHVPSDKGKFCVLLRSNAIIFTNAYLLNPPCF